ncbi:pickpocket protein 28-like [Frankliniella occidentalis]|uniref:Pickpocket protein 28-like n=1 Tax=Frankliniella occidentalis TaxID=133901 RepID=A0A6J1S2Z2_FRAOC|nr:pickpocket protein 28-like [Frankliniella occidentalis]
MTHLLTTSDREITLTVVADTRVDVRDYPFPSITVCPVANVEKSMALATLRLYHEAARRSRFPTDNNDTAEAEADQEELDRNHVRLLRALQEFRFPLYSSRWDDAKVVEGLAFLGTQDPRNVLLTAFPPCQRFFLGCSWKSNFSDCCDLFELQETNAGFCYSFNSCTSMSSKAARCRPRMGEPDDSQALYFSTVKAAPGEVLSPDPHSKGIVVVVANPYEFPVPSDGHYFPEDNNLTMRISASVTVQQADESLRGWPWTARECKFRDEGPLDIAVQYSQVSCVESCRLGLLAERCHCLPFHYGVSPASPLAELPFCNASGLQCVYEHKGILRNLYSTGQFRIPIVGEKQLGQGERASCECPPECDLLLYNSDYSTLGEAGPGPKDQSAVFFVRQRNLGAENILYLKSSRVSFLGFLANLGNLASLFLGVSFLSVLEFVWVSVSCLRTLSMKWLSF